MAARRSGVAGGAGAAGAGAPTAGPGALSRGIDLFDGFPMPSFSRPQAASASGSGSAGSASPRQATAEGAPSASSSSSSSSSGSALAASVGAAAQAYRYIPAAVVAAASSPLAVLSSVDKREIGDDAVWTLSSAKPGNGVEQLRDGSIETFWQSDGPQPHLINVQFNRKARVQEVALYLDYKLDESYTPCKILIRAGTDFQNLVDVQTVDLAEPCGWCVVPLAAAPHEEGLKADEKDDDRGGGSSSSSASSVRANLLQISILASHQNGRDTHVRQVQIFGPRPPATKGLGTELSQFSTIEFQQFSQLR